MGGLIISLVSVLNNNSLIAFAGIILAACFVIGESIIDAFASVKREIYVSDNKYNSDKI